MKPVIQFKATTLLPPIAFFAAVFISVTNPASADDLPDPGEPPLGSEYDDTVMAYYNGSMTACDALWMDEHILMDSALGKYGRTCGGRLERASQRQGNTCVEFFGHE
jgi:hypothetical protein